ncbi:MAG: aminotransferase class [Verrucomicrobia bacterium]|nr:aminotransferase class [Verrucomicrobiota bacterium]
MAKNYVQACTNGRLHDAREPSIAPLNRGFLYGDAIYEVWRTYHDVLFAWEEHWRRLGQSAAALHFSLPLTRDEARSRIAETVAAFRRQAEAADDLYIRLQVTRGAGAIGLDVALADRSDYVILVQANKAHAPAVLEKGLRLSLATAMRRNPADALNPAWKTGNYLNNILCLREAKARGADEVVILNQRGEVTEAAVSNIAFVRGGEVLTPPASAGILGGITRELLIGTVAPAAGVTMREATVTPEDFPDFEECFLLSTTKDVTPVSAIDDHRFRVGDESVAMRLKRAFAAYARSYATEHPELRME